MKSSQLIFLGLGAVLAASTLLLLQSQVEVTAPAATPAAVPAAVEKPLTAPAQIRSFEYEVAQGRRLSGPEVIQVRQGDELSLKVSVDQADELHLHGYDLHAQLRPGEPALLHFRAEHSGRFEFELHRSGLQLGVLEVLPQ